MVAKQEKENRKEIMNKLRENEKVEFENNLPMERSKFKGLFDYLDEELSKNDCDDTNKLTGEYLEKIGQNNIENILKWLADKSGYCDCEILDNVEEEFEKYFGENYYEEE
jgi:hypothetical protein